MSRRVMRNNNLKPADKMKALLLEAIINNMVIPANCKIKRPQGRGQPITVEITPLMGITPYTFEIKVTQVVTRMKTGGKTARRFTEVDEDRLGHGIEEETNAAD